MKPEDILALYRRSRAAELPAPVEIPDVRMSWGVSLDRPRPRMFFRVHPDTFKANRFQGVNRVALLRDPEGGYVGISKHAPNDLKALAVYRVPVLCCPADGQLFVWPIPVDTESSARQVAEVAIGKWIWVEWNPISMEYEVHHTVKTRMRQPKWTPFLRAQIRTAIMDGIVSDWDHPVARRMMEAQEKFKKLQGGGSS